MFFFFLYVTARLTLFTTEETARPALTTRSRASVTKDRGAKGARRQRDEPTRVSVEKKRSAEKKESEEKTVEQKKSRHTGSPARASVAALLNNGSSLSLPPSPYRAGARVRVRLYIRMNSSADEIGERLCTYARLSRARQRERALLEGTHEVAAGGMQEVRRTKGGPSALCGERQATWPGGIGSSKGYSTGFSVLIYPTRSQRTSPALTSYSPLARFLSFDFLYQHLLILNEYNFSAPIGPAMKCTCAIIEISYVHSSQVHLEEYISELNLILNRI